MTQEEKEGEELQVYIKECRSRAFEMIALYSTYDDEMIKMTGYKTFELAVRGTVKQVKENIETAIRNHERKYPDW